MPIAAAIIMLGLLTFMYFSYKNAVILHQDSTD